MIKPKYEIAKCVLCQAPYGRISDLTYGLPTLVEQKILGRCVSCYERGPKIRGSYGDTRILHWYEYIARNRAQDIPVKDEVDLVLECLKNESTHNAVSQNKIIQYAYENAPIVRAINFICQMQYHDWEILVPIALKKLSDENLIRHTTNNSWYLLTESRGRYMQDSTKMKISEWNALKLRRLVQNKDSLNEVQICYNYLAQFPINAEVKREDIVTHFIQYENFFTENDRDAASIIVTKALDKLKKAGTATNNGSRGYWRLIR